MKLGAFEELVLLAIASLGDNAYGVTVTLLLKEKTGKKPSVGALHAAFYRLEDKGCVSSHEGGATSDRGGRRKKYYVLTSAGKSALKEADAVRRALARNITGFSLG